MPLYLYGVVRPDCALPADLTGVGPDDSPVRTVAVSDGLGAVVSELDGEQPLEGRDVLAHKRVLDEVFTACTVLPFRFGTVAQDDEQLQTELEAHAGDYLETLQMLEDKVEVEVTASYDEDAVLGEILAARPDVRELSRSTQGAPEMRSLVELGEVVAEEVDRWRDAELARLVDRLAPSSSGYAERAPRQDAALRAAFLVARDSLPAFDAALGDLARETQGRYAIETVGPLPPYSFTGADWSPARREE
jgi:hypothetical protein